MKDLLKTTMNFFKCKAHRNLQYLGCRTSMKGISSAVHLPQNDSISKDVDLHSKMNRAFQ